MAGIAADRNDLKKSFSLYFQVLVSSSIYLTWTQRLNATSITIRLTNGSLHFQSKEKIHKRNRIGG